jgi:glutamate synthase (NADPH/NADH) large chain
MFLADAATGRIRTDEEVFEDLVDDRYATWLREKRVALRDLVIDEAPPTTNGTPAPDAAPLQRTFGYTIEHLRRLLEPMGEDAKDPVGAMGDDAPPAVLSNRNQTLFGYFKQLFAQVSNPPLDYIREDLVTSLTSHLGRQRNILGETPEHCRQLQLDSPILSEAEAATIRALDQPDLRTCTLDITFSADRSLEEAVSALQERAEQAVRDGCEPPVRTACPFRVCWPSARCTTTSSDSSCGRARASCWSRVSRAPCIICAPCSDTASMPSVRTLRTRRSVRWRMRVGSTLQAKTPSATTARRWRMAF